MREYDAYRGVYCAVCRSLGKRYGRLSRLVLTYDSTFYAMLLLALKPQCPGFVKKHCVVNPLKPCLFCQEEAAAAQAAALCVMLAAHKLRDDRNDRGKGRVRAFWLLPFTKRPYRRAAADYPWMEEAVRRGMEAQAAVEAQPDAGLDACADPTACMLGVIFAHASGADAQAPLTRVLQQVGYFLGRWVYLMDAADDVEKDAASGDFNWFVRAFSVKPDSPPALLEQVRLSANASLNVTVARLLAALRLVELNDFSSVLFNIVELGLPETQRQSLFCKDAKKEKS